MSNLPHHRVARDLQRERVEKSVTPAPAPSRVVHRDAPGPGVLARVLALLGWPSR